MEVYRWNGKRGMIPIGLATILGALPLALAVVQDWYVDVNAPLCPGGNGTPARPFCDIMNAVAAASDGDTILIAPGTYFENVVLDKDLELIGTDGEQVTVVDGCASGSVVRVEPNSVVALTGLTLTNGHSHYGGGLIQNNDTIVTLTSCSVSGNEADENGGGIAIVGRASHPGVLLLVKSTVNGNHSLSGGGIFVFEGTVTLTNSAVNGNSACEVGAILAFSGVGGIGIPHIELTMTNSIVSENVANAVGGIACSGTGQVTITDSTVAGNLDALGYGGLFARDVPCIVTNSILWDNGSNSIVLEGAAGATVEYSLIENGWPGIGNLDADPLFVDSMNGDFRLSSGSPCIDAGDNLSVPLSLWTDLDGKRRFIDDPLTPDTGRPGRMWPIVDMGAHEFGVDPPRKARKVP